jgi:aryl-phospho-beta-D-glucosidase BglC (GH1 family)
MIRRMVNSPGVISVIRNPLAVMYLPTAFARFLYALPFVSRSLAVVHKRSLQPLPFSSSDGWIVDADNNHVPYVGINWPGAADTMLPEGLGYQSIANIVDKITETGFNAVRLTFAIEMVDDILDNGGDVSLNDTLINALGQVNGTIVLQNITTNNPQFTPSTTRLQV